jgi:hypothetical protein
VLCLCRNGALGSARLRRVFQVLVAAASLPAFLAAAGKPEATPSLRILSDQPLPPALVKAWDVRWASDSSIYLSMLREGAVEASVDLSRPRISRMIAGMREPGGAFSYFLAASSEYLVTNGPLWVTWRSIADPARSQEAFDSIHDIDVFKAQLLVLAARRDDKGRFAPEGAVAWKGSLSRGLSDLKPVAYDAAGPGAENLGACSNFHMGGVRFLRDGSFLVVPGVQPGIHLYNSDGKLVRTWDSALVGLDADCASLTKEQVHRYGAAWLDRAAWLNQRRTLDDILPLPQGPGLVVRSVSEGRVRWVLKVLPKDGGIQTYRIPVQPQNDLSHLRGDIQGGRIVFILSATKRDDGMSTEVPRLVLAEAPK